MLRTVKFGSINVYMNTECFIFLMQTHQTVCSEYILRLMKTPYSRRHMWSAYFNIFGWKTKQRVLFLFKPELGDCYICTNSTTETVTQLLCELF